MPESILPPPVWVSEPAALDAMRADLNRHPRLAVDTESNSLHAYRERVCLIQFSTPETDYILDPLALTGLDALAPLFADPQTEKIFHAAEYDLICLQRDFGFAFNRLFDTMHAARVLGYPAVGLDRLLKDKFELLIDKKHQKANWAARPLTPEQIHYARLDTRYLFQLRDVFETELREKDRWELALEDFQRACQVTQPRANGAAWERFSGRRGLSPRTLTIVSELAAFREETARRMDRPPFKVLDDDTLLSVAQAAPGTVQELSVTDLSEKQVRLWGEAILTAVKRGTEAPLVKRKPLQRPDDAMLVRLEKLKAWRKQAAGEMKVESDIVLPKPYLQALAEQPPRDLGQLHIILARSPWRFEHFGAQILAALGG